MLCEHFPLHEWLASWKAFMALVNFGMDVLVLAREMVAKYVFVSVEFFELRH